MALSNRVRLLTALALGLSTLPAAAQQGAPGLTTHNVWIDFDSDGLDDLYVLTAGRDDALLRNLGDGGFADVTATSGLGGSRSALVYPADFDQDGTADLLRIARDGALSLSRGLVSGGFQSVTAETGLAQAPTVVGAEWIDYDRDGWIDLKLVTGAQGPMFFHNRSGMGFAPIDLGLTSRVATVVVDAGAEPVELAAELAATPDGDSTRRPVRDPDLGGGSLAAAAGGVSVGGVSGGPGGMSSGVAGTFCSPGLQDMASTNCLNASSVPELGQLYPITQELFVNKTNGRVGLGTTNPGTRLDVIGTARVSAGLIVNGNPIDVTDYRLRMFESGSGANTAFIDPTGASGGGELRLSPNTGGSTVELYADSGNDDGRLILREGNSLSGAILRARDVGGSGEGGLLNLFNPAGQASARLVADEGSGSGQLELRNGSPGNDFVGANLEAGSSSGGLLELYNSAGNRTVQLDAQTDTQPASLILREDDLSRTLQMDDNGITCYDGANNTTIMLDRMTGDASQPISADGFVKAAVQVHATGQIMGSFKHMPGSPVSVQRLAAGVYRVDFGTIVDSRFFSVSTNDPAYRGSTVRPFLPTGVEVRTFLVTAAGAAPSDSNFTVFVY